MLVRPCETEKALWLRVYSCVTLWLTRFAHLTSPSNVIHVCGVLTHVTNFVVPERPMCTSHPTHRHQTRTARTAKASHTCRIAQRPKARIKASQYERDRAHEAHTLTHSRTREGQHLVHVHTRFILMRCSPEVERIPRSQTRIRVAIPRVNPGSEPVQPPRLTGVWTVADTHTTHITTTFTVHTSLRSPISGVPPLHVAVHVHKSMCRSRP